MWIGLSDQLRIFSFNSSSFGKSCRRAVLVPAGLMVNVRLNPRHLAKICPCNGELNVANFDTQFIQSASNPMRHTAVRDDQIDP
jgi:hypothetical protein